MIDGVASILEQLRVQGKKIFFVTNNSTKSRTGFLKKFSSLGLTVQAEEIFSSSFAAAAYLEQYPLPAGKKVYIIGQEGIGLELDLLKIPHIGRKKMYRCFKGLLYLYIYMCIYIFTCTPV